MKVLEKPILFNTEMVQAILEGRKTQTRRVIKPQPASGVRKSVFVESGIEDGHGYEIKPPYRDGDILWVRETWQDLSDNEGEYVYLADGDKGLQDKDWGVITTKDIKWHPSIHMPRAAARIFLKVTDVRAERLQNMASEDCLKEGVKLSCKHDNYICSAYPCDFKNTNACKDKFKDIWDNCYKFPKNWDANPWVWVIEFEKVEHI